MPNANMSYVLAANWTLVLNGKYPANLYVNCQLCVSLLLFSFFLQSALKMLSHDSSICNQNAFTSIGPWSWTKTAIICNAYLMTAQIKQIKHRNYKFCNRNEQRRKNFMLFVKMKSPVSTGFDKIAPTKLHCCTN